MDGRLSHFVDGRGNTGNWMAYVNCARYAQEQNLIALQVNSLRYKNLFLENHSSLRFFIYEWKNSKKMNAAYCYSSYYLNLVYFG